MRHASVPVLLTMYSFMSGCMSTPNEPTLTLNTKKTPEEYVQCVVPKLRENALTPTLSQSQRHYKVVVSSVVAADNVIEAYKAPTGGKVFLYERAVLASSLMPSAFARAAHECL
jgi:hypothetical protein